ncbi:MAG TPA: uroporphyrinogen decarboxylase family protein [bacterium]|jgi:uroporphyrinogen-III decarboxylase|nr:uroporphyrinogen decarboxylase family protein [bacterium]HNT66347.1 uroporphyrinogen decarboxylase family protein [bacterium]HPG47151.1 uroporphyrinogen decarboxylase family protein [bacterium]
MKFTPAVYEHAASLIGKSPWEASRDGEMLFQGHKKAFELYHHSPVVVGIDIYNLEPEAYGSTIEKPKLNGIPAITHHLCSSMKEMSELPLFDPQSAGRIPMAIEAAKRLARVLPEADVRIPVSGPFSIASNLVRFETLLLEIVMDPASVMQALNHIVEGQVNFCRAIVEQGLDIAFFESAATPPIIPPQIFSDVVLPPLKSIIDQATAIVGHPVPCIIGGDTTSILASIMETGTGYVICPSETNQQEFMEQMKKHPEVMVRINMDPLILSEGDLPAVFKEVDRVVALAKGREKVCIGTGVLPYETKPETVLQTKEYISKL